DFADGEVARLSFPNNLSSLKNGRAGNALFAFNEEGKQCELTLRLLKGSADDRFLNGLLSDMLQQGVAFKLLNGKLVKKLGDGYGHIQEEQYLLTNGAFKRGVDNQSNATGAVEQAIAVYQLHFSAAPRLIA
ncbi:MAG: hypothetical protein FWE37_01070, partial [Spirochaetaceae bacterium]|nr:hypothetical protein [Spirochaetaceae bacterium]